MKISKILFLSSAIIGLLTACNPTKKQTKETQGTIICHWVGDPASLHPTNEVTQAGIWVQSFLHSYLVTTDVEKLQLRPDLAKALPTISEDGLSFEYELREGVHFDDGTALSVQDVIFSYKANKCPLVNNPDRRVYLDFLEDIIPDPANPLKFKMVMNGKYIQNSYMPISFPIIQQKFYDPGNVLANYSFQQLRDPEFMKNPPEELKKWADQFNDPKYGFDPAMISGLGPYKLEKWEEDQTLVIKRKEKYWQKDLKNPDAQHTAYPSTIIFKVLNDENAIALEFKKKELDASVYVSTRNLIELQKDAGFNEAYHSEFIQTFTFNYIIFNMKPDGRKFQKFFDDLLVRKAVAKLIPVDLIIDVIYSGKAWKMNGPVVPLKKEADPDLPAVTLDIEGAKALLAEAGWKDTDGDNILDKVINGKKVKFECALIYGKGNSIIEETLKLISDNLYKAGIKLTGDALDQKVYLQRVKNREFDLLLGAMSDGIEPLDYTQLWHTKSYSEGGGNYSGFGNAQTDSLIEVIRTEMNEDRRIQLSRNLQRIIVAEQPWVFMFSPARKIIISKKFDNAKGYPERPLILLNNLIPLQKDTVK